MFRWIRSQSVFGDRRTGSFGLSFTSGKFGDSFQFLIKQFFNFSCSERVSILEVGLDKIPRFIFYVAVF